MKKSLSLLVAIAMVFSMFASMVSAADKTAGEKLQDLGIITGTSEGLQEDAQWLRKDVTILLSRLLGVEEAAKAHANTHGFADLDAKGYNGYVSWAKEKGLFLGKSETEFGPNEAITYYQFATVILRALDQEQEKYEDNLAKAIELGLFAEDTKGTDNAVRGNIYSAVVSALDVKVDGVKLGTILGLKGYEVVAVEAVSAKAVNSKNVVVTFNQEVTDVVASNFDVVDADANIQVIEKVAVSGSNVTITFASSLKDGKEYFVTANGVLSADKSQTQTEESTVSFTFTAKAPASVKVTSSTVAFSNNISAGDYNTVEYAIYDAEGNDITVDVDGSAIEVTSSNENAVYPDGTELVVEEDPNSAAGDVLYAVVNVEVEIDEDGNTIETGATVVKVQESVAVVSEITEVTFGAIGDPAELSLVKGLGNERTLSVKVIDTDKQAVSADLSFKSSNSRVAVVDEKTGEVTGVVAGTANITVSAKFNGKTVTKVVTVTVKDAPKFTGINVDKTSASVVIDSGLTETVKITLVDQYGDKFTDSNVDVTVEANKNDVVDGYSKTSPVTLSVNGETTITVDHDSSVSAATTAVLTIKAGSVSKKVNVSFVKGGEFVGYKAEITATKLDQNPARNDGNVTVGSETYEKDTNAVNDKTAEVTVYEVDRNGNKLRETNNDVTVADEKSTIGEGVVDVIAGVITPIDGKKGTEKITVLVDSARVATFTVEVVDTRASLSKVTQVQTAITVNEGDSVLAKLFGTTKDGAAFVGFNQYGGKIAISADDYTIYSSNQAVVENDGDAIDAGTTQLTIVLNNTVYNVTVVVKESAGL